jgi:hypothetical protein
MITLGLLMAGPHTLQSQVDSTLVGQRIRIRVPEVRQFEAGPNFLEIRGALAGVTGDSLYVRMAASGAAVAIGRERIARLAVSRGKPSRLASAERSALMWGALGALWGFVLHTSGRDQANTWQEEVGTLATVGAVTGFVLGLSFPYERWRNIRLRR